jgi:hypothetical protein
MRLGPENDCADKTSSNCKGQTRPLVKESAPHKQTRNCVRVIKVWLLASDGCFIPRQTSRLTVGPNVRLWVTSSTPMVPNMATCGASSEVMLRRNDFGNILTSESIILLYHTSGRQLGNEFRGSLFRFIFYMLCNILSVHYFTTPTPTPN